MLFQQVVKIPIRDAFNKDADRLYDLGTGGGQALGQIVSRGVQAAILLSGIAVMIYLLIGGYKWLMAGGDKSKVEEARTQITNAVIGIAIIASVWVIYGLIDNFFGIGNLSPSTSHITCYDCLCGGSYCSGACFDNRMCAPR